MEEILILIIQFVVEILFQMLFELFFDFYSPGSRWRRSRGKNDGCSSFPALCFTFLFVGAALGGIVNTIHPSLFLHARTLRLIHFFLSPLLVGGAAWLLNHMRSKVDSREAFRHGVYGFLFALGYNAIRLAYGVR